MRRLLLPVLLFLAFAVALPPAQAQEPVAAVIDGPTSLAPSTTRLYGITVTGGPGAVNGTFEISYVLEGANLAGGDPQTPRILTNADGRFAVNITTPSAEGTITLFVKATSRGATNETTEVRFAIDVFRPVELRATLRNRGAAAAVNVSVVFYVDGVRVGDTTVARIDAGGQTTVNISYIPVGLTPGRHTVRIEADLDGDGRISPDAGELLVIDFFYKTGATNLPAILGTVTVVILVLLVFLLLAIRRQRRQG